MAIFMAPVTNWACEVVFSKNAQTKWMPADGLEFRVSIDDMNQTSLKTLSLLSGIPQPELIEYRVDRDLLPMIGLDGTQVIPISTHMTNEKGQLTRPELVHGLIAHETFHPVFSHAMNQIYPGLEESVIKPQSAKDLQKAFEKLKDAEGREAVQKIMVEMKEIRKRVQSDYLKGTVLRSFDEFLADLTAVIVTGDPRTIYKLGPKNMNDRLYLIAYKYRRFDLSFGAAGLQAWKDDMAFYNQDLDKEHYSVKPDLYIMLSPLRSWTWDLIKQKVATNSSDLPQFMSSVFQVMVEELPKALESVEQNGRVDLEELNRALFRRISEIPI